MSCESTVLARRGTHQEVAAVAVQVTLSSKSVEHGTQALPLAA